MRLSFFPTGLGMGTLGRFEPPSGGGLVWVLGTKHRAAFLRSLLRGCPDTVTIARPDDPALATVGSMRPGGIVVLDGAVRSIAWIRDEAVSGLILRRPPGLTVVVCADVPMHATDALLGAVDAVALLPTRAKPFAPLAYRRYLRGTVEHAVFRREWEALLERRADTQHCLVWERGVGGLRRVAFWD